jgi:murein DD-endopeptidase MepM/ murein hydrolase activator NlpD
MVNIKESSLLGSAPSSIRKVDSFLRLSDLKTDNNIKKSSFLNTELDNREEKLADDEAKISSVSLMTDGENLQQQLDPTTFYSQGFVDALKSLTEEMGGSQQQEQQNKEPSPAGLVGGMLGAGGFAALSGTSGSVAYGGKTQAPLTVSYSPFKSSQPIISGVGYRQSTGTNHKGYDVSAPSGTPLYAYFPGVVTKAGYDSGYGNYIEWKDSVYGETHFFGHLIKPANYKQGQTFDQGALLGNVGSTGRSEGPHLHWEIGPRGGTVDPGQWTRTHPMKTKDTEAAKIKPEIKSKPGDLKPSTTATATRTLIQPVIAQSPSQVQSGQLNRQGGGSNTSNFTTMASNLSSIG